MPFFPLPWCRSDARGPGPSGLARVPPPFPFATTRLLSIVAMATGYQPTGMRPASRPVPDVAWPAVFGERSKIATALASASATNSRDSSDDRVSAFGVLPSAGPAGGGSSSSPIRCRDLVSMIVTRSVLADATNRRLPARFSKIADG